MRRPDPGRLRAAVACVAFLAAWSLLHAPLYSHAVISDTRVYAGFGDQMRIGAVPYRDFAVEYPPAALPVFVAPTFISGYRATFEYPAGELPRFVSSPDLGSYSTTFGWLMAACGLATLLGVAASRPSRLGLAFVAVSPLLIGSLALSRYDFWPAALAAAALAALLRDRHRIGWALLGAAIATKLYPCAVVPLAVVWTWRRAGGRELRRAAAVGAGVIAAIFLPFFVLAPHGLWTSLWGQFARPLQIESLAGSWLMLSRTPNVIGSHGSLSLSGAGAWSTATSVVGLASLTALWIAFAARPIDRERLLRYTAASICVFVAFDKVLSPQYLIWLVPVVPLVAGLRGRLATIVLAAIFGLTFAYFPARYYDFVHHDHGLAAVVFARDLALVGLALLLSLPAPGRARSS